MAGKLKPFTIRQILRWADLHHARTGRWPNTRTGPILDQPDRTWLAVETALIKGSCGLPGGSSLYRLLKARRRINDARMAVPDLTLDQVMRWVDSHFAITGEWPYCGAGPVLDCPEVSWITIDRRMRRGGLSLPRGTTLARWLREARDVWDGGKPRLTRRLVLDWARQHFNYYGRWPVTNSGPVLGHPEENWAAIDVGLRNQRRGCPETTSLCRILREEFGDEYDAHIGLPNMAKKRREPRRISTRRQRRRKDAARRRRKKPVPRRRKKPVPRRKR